MDFANEAGEIRAFKRVVERGFVYRGLKPVYWCFDCGSSLAEFEIEYADKKSPDARRRPSCAPSPTSWRPPSAWPVAGEVGLRGDLDHDARGRCRPTRRSTSTPSSTTRWCDTERGLLVLAAALVEKCLARYGLQGHVVATAQGEKLGGIAFRHPLAHVHAGYDRLAPVYLADYATAEDGTGIVHSSPAYGVDDFNSCRPTA